MVPTEGSRPGEPSRAENASQAMALRMPALPGVRRANRAFQARAVQHMLTAGIRQFLDLGSGIPDASSVPEIARRHDCGVRVLHVELDPVTARAATQLLAGNPNAAMICADLRHPDQILAHPDLRRLLDLGRPVGVLAVAVLHLIPDADDPAAILGYLHDAFPVGSYLALSHLAPVQRQSPRGLRELMQACAHSGDPVNPRGVDQVEALLGNWRLKPPGLVACPQWRPDKDTESLDGDVTFPVNAALTRKTADRQRRSRPTALSRTPRSASIWARPAAK